jgi:DNA mismatch endonuclease (patch repair protein)
MPDKFSKETRSKIMSSIRGKNTKPEIIIRKMLWARGGRYRIHDGTVFGTPDISIKRKKIAIFIDGCFWHGCKKCYKEPKTNTVFWQNKILRNKKRRLDVRKTLRKKEWITLEFWEHEVNNSPELLVKKILDAL